MSDVASPSALWITFTAKAELVGAAVMRSGAQHSLASLLRTTAGQYRCTGRAAERFPSAAGSSDASAVKEVVAAGEFAVAETGSIALQEADADRGACFLSERLWVLVEERDVVASLEQGMRRMRELVLAGARHPLLMTGPSRTADIERVLTIGVHGPRALVIVVVEEA